MKNTLLLLLSTIILSACSTKNNSNSDNNRAIIEDMGTRDEVNAIEMEQANFTWDNNQNTKSIEPMPKKAVEKALSTLIASGGKLVLYFEYDKDAVSMQSAYEIEKHIEFMQANPKIRLRLEGHADENGTREYNLALSENRALNVKAALGDKFQHRIEVVGYGEENLVSTEHAKNRRVNFIYK